MPFPLIVTDGRRQGEYIINVNSTLYEITPYEFGSWDEHIDLFVPTQYVGSNLSNGLAATDNICVNRFDNAAYARLQQH
jgi:lysophospholipase